VSIYELLPDDEDYHHRNMVARGEMITALNEYVRNRRPLGSFLMAVLSNDLADACQRADPQNCVSLPALVAYLYNHAPASCWGSLSCVEAWLEGDPKK